MKARLCAMILMVAAPGVAGQVTLTKLVDSLSFSAGPGEFSFLGVPSIDGDEVAFVGYDDALLTGVYVYNITSGDVIPIADTTTPIPGGTGNFTGFGLASPSIDGGNVTFVGFGDQQEGIYLSIGGVLMEIADGSTAVPGGTGAFSILGRPSVSGLNVAFHGFDDNFDSGVFADTGGIVALANTSTVMPGTAAMFDGFGQDTVVIEGASMVFQGFGSSADEGLFGNVNGPLHALADLATPIPGGIGNFAEFSWGGLSLDSGKVAFNGRGPGGQEGLYATPSRLLADLSNPPTTGSTTFMDLDFPDATPAISGGGAAYVGVDDLGTKGVYAEYGHVQVLVSPINPFETNVIGPEGMDGNRVVYLAGGDIFLAELTAPGDRDGDGDVDTLDFAVLASCFNKSGRPPRTIGCSSNDADFFDFDDDGDVDGIDFAKFASCFNKSGRTPRCID